jgi:hypothetical protein
MKNDTGGTIRLTLRKKIRKRKKLGHVILALCTTYLVAYNPNIKFPNIIDVYSTK